MNFIPGYDCIGRGYDVFKGEYATSKGILGPQIFNLGAAAKREVRGRKYDVPADIVTTTGGGGDSYSTSGLELKEYVRKVEEKASLSGVYRGFKATLDVRFSSDHASVIFHSFTTRMEVFYRWTLSLPNVETLRTKLLPSAATDIETMEPFELFATYGTHYTSCIFVGARADYSLTVSKSAVTSNEELEVGVEGAYAEAQGSSSTTSSSTVKRIKENSTARFFTVGGQESKTSLVGDLLQNYTEWRDSIDDPDKNLESFYEFGTNGLAPIWELASTQARRDELASRYEEYVTEKNALRYGDVILLVNEYAPNWLTGCRGQIDGVDWAIVRTKSGGADEEKHAETYRWQVCADPLDTKKNAGEPVRYGDLVYLKNMYQTRWLTGDRAGGKDGVRTYTYEDGKARHFQWRFYLDTTGRTTRSDPTGGEKSPGDIVVASDVAYLRLEPGADSTADDWKWLSGCRGGEQGEVYTRGNEAGKESTYRWTLVPEVGT